MKKKNHNGSIRAKRLLEEIGFDEITDLPMHQFVSGLGATLIEEPLTNSDGKIVRGRKKTLIKINSGILYEEKKRFTMAHEVGHYLLHDHLEVHNENSNTLNWFHNAEKQMQKGIQEWEANDFAAELLMPEKVFRDEVAGKSFSPKLLSDLASRFKSSITSVVFRIFQLDIRPIFIAFIHNGKVRYWKKSDDLKGWVKDIIMLPPPDESVAKEYIDSDYNFIYLGEDKQQPIYKSTWFDLKENQEDSDFYEYCIPTKQYKTIISVVWED